MLGRTTGLEKDGTFFRRGHWQCGDWEEHIGVLGGEPVFEREGLRCGGDDAEGGVCDGELAGF